MILQEGLINGEQDEKKFSESDLSFARNTLLESLTRFLARLNSNYFKIESNDNR